MKKFTALSAVVALALVACQFPGNTEETIKIGLITPLTGEIASIGNDVLHGTQIKLKEINDAGGIDGRLIELVVEDGRCTGADAASAAQKLVNVDQVVAIHGAGCSGESLAAAPIVEAAQIVMISPSSSSPDVTDAGDFVFRTYPNDALKTAAMAQYFKDQGFTKVAVISENTDFCVGFRDSLKKDMGDSAELIFDEMVAPETKDYRALMARLTEVEFDVFVANAQTPPTGSVMLQQLREQGMEQLVISQDVMDSTVVIELAGEASEGLQVINVPTISEESEFGQKFVAEYGAPESNMAWAGYGYDTLGVLAQTIAEVGTDGPAMRDYLYGMDKYAGVVGNISFDENGDVVGVKYALREVKDGAFVKISDIEVN